MTEDRRRAMEKQRAKGNSPEDTRMGYEELRDFGHYRTGFSYRMWLDNKLKKKGHP